MQSFTAKTNFQIVDETAFNRYVSGRVVFWTDHLKKRNITILNPVELALAEAAEKPDLIRVSSVFEYQVRDQNREIATYRAKHIAPEAFRAMFAEEATC